MRCICVYVVCVYVVCVYVVCVYMLCVFMLCVFSVCSNEGATRPWLFVCVFVRVCVSCMWCALMKARGVVSTALFTWPPSWLHQVDHTSTTVALSSSTISPSLLSLSLHLPLFSLSSLSFVFSSLSLSFLCLRSAQRP